MTSSFCSIITTVYKNSVGVSQEGARKSRLREQVRTVMRLHHYSIRTEKPYLYWIRNFIRFHQLRHTQALGSAEVNAFLTRLAAERNMLPIDNQEINTATMLSNG